MCTLPLPSFISLHQKSSNNGTEDEGKCQQSEQHHPKERAAATVYRLALI